MKARTKFFCTPVLLQWLFEPEHLNPSSRFQDLRISGARGSSLGLHVLSSGYASQQMLQGEKGNRCSCGKESASALGCSSSQLGLRAGESGSHTALWRSGSVVISECHCALIASTQVFSKGIMDTKWRKTIHKSLISLSG